MGRGQIVGQRVVIEPRWTKAILNKSSMPRHAQSRFHQRRLHVQVNVCADGGAMLVSRMLLYHRFAHKSRCEG